jgi:urease gamma subunit
MSQLDPNSDIKDNSNMLSNGVVDTDIKSESNLLNNSDTVQDVTKKVLTTEVTSLAQEELNTGVKVEIPDAEELYSRSIASYIRNMKHLSDLVNYRNGGSYKISRKGMNRILTSILQLPQDGLQVTLQGEEEKSAFALGQRIIADRFIVTQYHIFQEKKRLQEEKLNGNVTKTEDTSTKTGEQNV